MFPISLEVLESEVNTIKKYVDKWQSLIENEGIPGVDIPMTGLGQSVDIDTWLVHLISELKLISGKCDNLSNVVSQFLGNT